MAINPMQRKSRNSFLLGMFIMLLVTGIIIAVLLVQITNMKEEEQQREQSKVTVYTLAQDVKSGQTITEDLLIPMEVDISMVPANAIAANVTVEEGKVAPVDIFLNQFLVEKSSGQTIKTNEEGNMYITINNQNVTVYNEPGTDRYYTMSNNNQKQYIEVQNNPIVAKVDLKANTVVTLDMVSKANQAVTDDARIQEYNMISLPVELEVGDYVDIRLTLQTGQDYLVLAKKQILDATADTIKIQLSELEMLTMSDAIITAYTITGSKFYATTYIDPGMQAEATPTYPVSNNVGVLIQQNPNIIQEVKDAFRARYNTEQREGAINPALNQYAESAKGSIESGVAEDMTKQLEAREQYWEELNAAASGSTVVQ